MLSTTIFPGRYVQGRDARKRLGQELSRYGKKGIVICDSFVYEKLIWDFEPYMKDGVDVFIEKFGGECSDEEINRLLNIIQEAKFHFVVGLGGGKTMDTAKAVAYEASLPVAIVPTLAASDAPCSAVSVIYTPEGEFKRYLFLPHSPNLVLMDTHIISNAPVRFLIAGMGDALATWFEAESCMKKYAPNMTGDLGSRTAYSLAKLCYETLLEYGLTAKTACEYHIVTPALDHIVEANTLLSGLGFESAGLAAAHAIHNGLTVLDQTHHYYHGEKVAFGTLASLFLTDKPIKIIDEVYSFCESIGLPTTLADIGLTEISDEKLMKVAQASCLEGETIHNEPTPVNPDMVFSALKAADAEGKRRKSSY
ncbi:glycerol dehydrogenase [Aphanothece hegewaldii CCALA 016]|uniref:Glycerol dehydrogenase n=1 Tax=Aphanothece hegewaldii CCALA 016 TaxID=2107694 RepID=A0A2T1M2L5_9CHRO|nr:glycerol dehydrogenase [Aphanothece hegewaldii]PSF38989.1 glycerol dehydrogenase [Aphanothece hegewaldii CCALA 016]